MKMRPSILIAVLALFVAIGGTATAAGLINGKKIKAGTVTAKSIKNQTITTAKISTSALAAFAGDQGPRGERGPRGDKGPQGDQGEAGAPGTTALSSSVSKVAQPANITVQQVVMDDLPNSRYLATAKVSVVSQTAGSEVQCTLESPGGISDTAQWTNPANNSRAVLWMVLPTEFEIGEIWVECTAGISSASFKTTLTAVPTL